ncbi:MAG: hypothetical protein ACKO6N_21345 [Myxococcota bacterium]
MRMPPTRTLSLAFISLLATLALSAQERRANPGLPPLIYPWLVPADRVPVPRAALERFEAGGIPIRARVEPSSSSLEATLLIRTHDLSPAVQLALAYQLRFGGGAEFDGPTFSAELARVGAERQVEVFADHLELTLRGPASPVPAGKGQTISTLELLAAVVSSSSSSEPLLSRTQEELRATLGVRQADPLTVTLDRIRQMVFQSHPYALGLKLSDLENLDAERLATAQKSALSPSRCMLAITSPLESALLKPLIEQTFAGWNGGGLPDRVSLPPLLEAASIQTLASPNSRMVVGTGRMVLPGNPQERAIARILAQVIASGLQRITPERELFRVGARLEEHADAALLWAWVEGTVPGNTEALLRQELARVGQGQLVVPEIEAARAHALAALLAPLQGMPRWIRGEARLELLRGPQTPETGLALDVEQLKLVPPSAVADMGRALFGTGAVALVLTSPAGSALPDVAPAPAQAAPAAPAPAEAEHGGGH